MANTVKRVNIMLGEEQYERLSKAKINISSFIRDLLEDHFSQTVINISVNQQTFDLYNEVISNTGATDEDIEPYLKEVLKKVLDKRMKQIEKLRLKLK